MRRKKDNFQGSTLVLLVLTISVVMIIATAVLSLAVMNFKMKKLNSKVEKAFYLSEAGVDEAYMISRNFVKDAINYATNEVEDFNEIVYQNESADSNRQGDLKSYRCNNDELNEVFQSSFKDFIKGIYSDAPSNKGILNSLNDSSSYLIYEDGYPKIVGELIEKSNYFFIEIKSTYINEQIKEEIVLKLKLVVPEYKGEALNANVKIDGLLQIIDWKIER